MKSGTKKDGTNIQKQSEHHIPVLLKESIHYLAVKKGGLYIDATLGGGGHSAEILKHGGKLLAIDQDPEATKAAREYLSTACPDTNWQLASGNFARIGEIAKANGFLQADGILFDLGISSWQLEASYRGFSFNCDGPLDMRMDPEMAVTAADLVNALNKGELAELFFKLGDERFAKQIAENICESRKVNPIRTCDELVNVIIKARPRGKFDRTHPATKCFQALRIAVNDELNNLKIALPQAVDLLKSGGRLVVISFHSGEERIVKQFIKDKAKSGSLTILTSKPIRPTVKEIEANPRSRSASLRSAEKK